MDRLTKKQRSRNMSSIKSKNTKPEIVLFAELRKLGFVYRKHAKLPGKPDAVIPEFKLAIFVDGEFWHGKGFREWKGRLSPFWLEKITSNIRRDRKNNRLLQKNGWTVIHIWGKQIIKEPKMLSVKLNKVIKIPNPK